MRAFEFLLEKTQAEVKKANAPTDPNAVPGDPTTDPLYSLKLAIAHKIKDLPPSDDTKNSLQEIEDIIDSMQLGGRKKATLSKFDEKDAEGLLVWKDTDVQSAKEMLAKYIVGLDAPIEYKRSMIEQWKNGGLIDVDILFSTGKPKQHPIGEIVKGYDTNPAVKEFATDLMQVGGVGVGKGEFMLKVLSPKITKPAGNKGDIEVIGYGTVEVKTTDGGAGRFTDRQVKPGKGYQSAVNSFFDTFKQYLEPTGNTITTEPAEPAAPEETDRLQKLAGVKPSQATKPNTKQPPVEEAKEKKPKKLSSDSGINIEQLHNLHNSLPAEVRGDFVTKLTAVLDQVFVSKETHHYSGAVVNAITSQGGVAKAKQLYGVGVLNNYMAQKTDKGILYINLKGSPPTFTFFTDNASLNASNMRLNIETAYPVSNDIQLVYPKTTIVSTAQAQPNL
jgi:hypothetical protein